MTTKLPLKAQDLRWATWRNTPPEPKPSAPVFDFDKAIHQISRVRNKYYYYLSGLKLAPIMSRTEAEFWLVAMTYEPNRNLHYKQENLIESLKKQRDKFDGSIDAQEVSSRFSNLNHYGMSPEMIIPLVNLLNHHDLMKIISTVPGYYSHANPLVRGFRDYVLPYLTDSERESIRTVMRPYMQQSNRLASFDLIAAMVGGFDDEMEAILIKQQQHYSMYKLYFAFGLSDPDKVQQYAREQKMYLINDDTIMGWLAHTDTAGLDWLAKSVIVQGSQKGAKPLFKHFNKFTTPESVLPVLDVLEDKESKAKPDALKWLQNNDAMTADVLTPITLTDHPQKASALKYLRRMINLGEDSAIRASAEKLSDAEKEQFNELVLEYVSDEIPEHNEETTPDWLASATEKLLTNSKQIKKLKWVDTISLPALTVEGRRLNNDQLMALMVALSGANVDETNRSMLEAIRNKSAAIERDDFTWGLFQQWMDYGSPSKDKWAFNSMGKLGSDAIVMRLTPLIRKWPGESLHKRAVDGLDILRDIGTDTAIMQINGIAQKVRYKGLQNHANKVINAIAKARNLTQAELEDRIIPDCDLDESGQRIFDYGRRKFTFVLTGDMKPMVRDEVGKLKANLPKPGKTDDEVLAPQANEEWKLIKKQIKEVAKVQSERLESGMVSQRRWKLGDFEQFYLKHPLMVHIIRLILWGAYNADGEMISPFRVTDEREIVDMDDEPLSLDKITHVGVLHPMEMSEGDMQEWGEVLSDYEIIPPFEQLSRPITRVEKGMEKETELAQFSDFKVEGIVLVSILQKAGWDRGPAMDGGVYYSHARYFPFADVTAIVTYDGLAMGSYDWNSEQHIKTCYFVEGQKEPEGYSTHKDKIPLGKVPPVVYSETMRTLHAIAGKALAT